MKVLSWLLVIGLGTPLAWGAEREIVRALDAPQPLSPVESLQKVRVPGGFEMRLVASEPIVKEPSGIAFDEWGRLFVCELHGYNVEGEIDVRELNESGTLDREVRRIRWEFLGGDIAEEAARRQFGVVKLLSDRDGDGVMDHAELWADDLPPCYGLVPARGGIIAACAPDIVFLADRDHDGKVDYRETLFSGFKVRTLERGINNPRWGFDGWIYVGGAGNGGTITGPYLEAPVVLGSSDFRIKADGSAIEPVTGRVGTFGMTLNRVGDRFPSSGGTPAIYALPIPYRYLERNPFVASPGMNYRASHYDNGFRLSEPHPWRVRRRQDPAWIKFYGERETKSNYFSGGCSGEYYAGGMFPDEFDHNLFYCEPSLNIIHRTVISREGNGYLAERSPDEAGSEFLASTDQWFRPMSLRVGPDGGMYIVDMYREIIEDYSAIPRFLQQQYGLDRGRDRGRIWRLQASVEAGAVVLNGGLGNADVAALVKAIGQEEAWWRSTAQRLIVERGERSAAEGLRAYLQQNHSAASVLTAVYALEGLGELSVADVRSALGSPFYEVRVHGLRLSERFSGKTELLPQVLDMISDPDSRVRLQVALTLGAWESRAATAGLVALVKRFGEERWMDSAVLSSARGRALAMLRELGEDESGRGLELIRPLAATLIGEGRGDRVGAFFEELSEWRDEVQLQCLEGIWDGREGLAGWRGEIGGLECLLTSVDEEVRFWAVRMVAKVQPKSPGLREVFEGSRRDAEAQSLGENDRLQALRMVGEAPFGWRRSWVPGLLGAAESLSIQLGAVNALGAGDDAEVGEVLLVGWESYGPTLRKRVLEVLFARERRLGALASTLLDERVAVGDLGLREQETLVAGLDGEDRKRLQELFDREERRLFDVGAMDRFEEALRGEPDVARGEAVFRQVCASCHRVGEIGVEVGPALGSIAGKPNEGVLLDLLSPNDKVDPEYRTYLVTTRSGEQFSGLLATDGPTSVTLRQAQGIEQVVLRKDIAELRSSELSLMPANLGEVLSPEELGDLLGFLRSSF